MSARYVLLLAGLLAFVPSSVEALEIKSLRPSYGPIGATRQDLKYLPGDFLFVNYEIEGLKLDAKNVANFNTMVEVFDAANKSIYKKPPAGNVVIPQLGGNRLPGDFHLTIGTEHPPGKYLVRLSVQDLNSKEVTSASQTFEILPKGFGLVKVSAPTVAFPGHPYLLNFGIIDLSLDAKKKPNAKLEMKVFDEAGKSVSTPIVGNYPADLPEEMDLSKNNQIPIDLPIFPNRTGRFTVEINVTDNITMRTASIRYPFTVLDIGSFAGK